MEPTQRAFWREPVAWLVLLLPVGTLLAAAVTLRLFWREPADSNLSQARRIAQVQIEDLSLDRAAARLGLQAQLSVDAASGNLALALHGEGGAEALDLWLLHPTRAAQDRTLSLAWDGTRWRGRTQPWHRAQAWEVQVVNRQRGWRLKGRLTGGVAQSTLAPAIVP